MRLEWRQVGQLHLVNIGVVWSTRVVGRLQEPLANDMRHKLPASGQGTGIARDTVWTLGHTDAVRNSSFSPLLRREC